MSHLFLGRMQRCYDSADNLTWQISNGSETPSPRPVAHPTVRTVGIGRCCSVPVLLSAGHDLQGRTAMIAIRVNHPWVAFPVSTAHMTVTKLLTYWPQE